MQCGKCSSRQISLGGDGVQGLVWKQRVTTITKPGHTKVVLVRIKGFPVILVESRMSCIQKIIQVSLK